jgi:RNA polymerase sigma-70 factor, ECF subfamily
MYSETLVLRTQQPQPYFPQEGVLISFLKSKQVQPAPEWEQLLEKVSSAGCLQSYRKVFNHFYPLLIQQNIKKGLSKEVASELAQETMLRVWKQAKSFDAAKGNASLWIFVIARNLRFDHFRQKRNDPLDVSSIDLYADDDLFQTDSDLESNFDLEQLKKNLARLPDEQQSVIQKIYFEGMTQNEVSQQGNIPLGTVKSRVRLALLTIKELMEGKSK